VLIFKNMNFYYISSNFKWVFLFGGREGANGHLNESINTKLPVFFWNRCPNAKIYHIWKVYRMVLLYPILICFFVCLNICCGLFYLCSMILWLIFVYIGKIIDYNILNFLFNFIFECVYVHVCIKYNVHYNN